jgi:hypothetical protein
MTTSSSARRYGNATHLSSSSIANQDELESRDVGRFRHGRRCYGGVVEGDVNTTVQIISRLR